jgi:hypothetical protein
MARLCLPHDITLEYFGVTNEQAQAYAAEMASQGWEIEYEDLSEQYWDENTNVMAYSCSLKKDDIYAGIYTDGMYGFRVGFANMSEMLY